MICPRCHKEHPDSVIFCPYCGGEMVLRKRKGDGKSFYGCKSYPRCRGIINVE